MSNRRIAITGLGCIAPNGNSVGAFWHALTSGISGLGYISRFETENLPSRIAGEVLGFAPEARLSAKDLRRMDRVIQLGMISGMEAFENSGLDLSDETRELSGVLIGAGIGGIETIENTTRAMAGGQKKVSPFYIPASIINMVSGDLSIELGLRGPNLAITTACSTGTHCIGISARLIAAGDAKVMIAGGTEASITPSTVAGFTAARALSKQNEDPQRASRPFDKNRDGFVIAGGGGTLVLEDYEYAKARGAKIYAEITGYGATSDGYDMVQPSGEGAIRCMQQALQSTQNKIDYINTHGTSTPVGDIKELEAIKKVFKNNIPYLSSTKSLTGHSLGATGVQESIYCLLMMENNFLTGSANIQNLDENAKDYNILNETIQKNNIFNIMSNSFGFGGTNATLVFSKI